MSDVFTQDDIPTTWRMVVDPNGGNFTVQCLCGYVMSSSGQAANGRRFHFQQCELAEPYTAAVMAYHNHTDPKESKLAQAVTEQAEHRRHRRKDRPPHQTDTGARL